MAFLEVVVLLRHLSIISWAHPKKNKTPALLKYDESSISQQMTHPVDMLSSGGQKFTYTMQILKNDIEKNELIKGGFWKLSFVFLIS